MIASPESLISNFPYITVLSEPAAATNQNTQTHQSENFSGLIAQSIRVRAQDDGGALDILKRLDAYDGLIESALRQAGSTEGFNPDISIIDPANINANITKLQNAAKQARQDNQLDVADKLASVSNLLEHILKMDEANKEVKKFTDTVKAEIANRGNFELFKSYGVPKAFVRALIKVIDAVNIDQRTYGIAKAAKVDYEKRVDLNDFSSRLEEPGYKNSAIRRIEQKLGSLVLAAQHAGEMEYDLRQATKHFESLFNSY